jgi:hypothetical protein
VLLFVGDDWSEAHHDVELMDVSGGTLVKARLPEGVAGMARLHAMIAEALGEDAEEAEVLVGIETERGPWVAALIAVGYTVFAINPLQVARYRQRHSVSGAKSDAADAHTLADMEPLRRLPDVPKMRTPGDFRPSTVCVTYLRSSGSAAWTTATPDDHPRSSNHYPIPSPPTGPRSRYGSRPTPTGKARRSGHSCLNPNQNRNHHRNPAAGTTSHRSDANRYHSPHRAQPLCTLAPCSRLACGQRAGLRGIEGARAGVGVTREESSYAPPHREWSPPRGQQSPPRGE